jgi:hypothetical protein
MSDLGRVEEALAAFDRVVVQYENDPARFATGWPLRWSTRHMPSAKGDDSTRRLPSATI